MSSIVVWIVLFALTATSAYRYPYPTNLQRHLGQNVEYQTEDESLENETSILEDYQQRPKDVQSIYQKYRGDSSPWRPNIPIQRALPFEYYGKSIQDRNRISPLKNIQIHNRYSSFEIDKSLPKTYQRVANEKEALELDRTLFSFGRIPEGQSMFTPQISEECEELGICENSSDYPHEYVEALLAMLPESHIIFNLDKEPREIPHRDQIRSNQTVPLCKPNVRVIYPDKVRTKMDEWVFVVNGKNHKVQGFSVTKCVAPGKHCDHSVTFIQKFRPTCVEKGTDRSMWALDGNGRLTLVTASIPSCCICELKKIQAN